VLDATSVPSPLSRLRGFLRCRQRCNGRPGTGRSVLDSRVPAIHFQQQAPTGFIQTLDRCREGGEGVLGGPELMADSLDMQDLHPLCPGQVMIHQGASPKI
jgi:hypothetical protein